MKKYIIFLALSIFWGSSFSQSNTCVSPSNNLISWWAAEDNANDVVGGNHGTTNGVIYGPGTVNKAFLFDGVDDRVVVPSNNNLDITGDLTVEFWAEQTVFNPENMVVCKGAQGEPTVFSMYFLGATFICAFQDTNGAIVELGGPSFEDWQWHHYAYVRQGSQHIIYADGFDFGWYTFTDLPASSAGLPLTIGAQYDNKTDNYTNFFGGSIDEVSVYNRALSQAEIQSIFNAEKEGKCSVALSAEEQLSRANHINIYPNPVANMFTLDLSKSTFLGNDNLKLQIYDSSGRLVKQFDKINGVKRHIDITQLNSGFYLYQLSGNGNHLASGKLAKR